MFGLGVPELLLILVIGLVIFGPGKLSESWRREPAFPRSCFLFMRILPSPGSAFPEPSREKR